MTTEINPREFLDDLDGIVARIIVYNQQLKIPIRLRSDALDRLSQVSRAVMCRDADAYFATELIVS